MTLPAEYTMVADPAALERAGLFVAEGRLVVQRLLEAGRFLVHSVAATPSALAALEPALDAMATRPPLFVCDVDELRATTGFDFHRGCLALAYRPETQPFPDFSSATRLLALEGVGNPDNLGGLFRTAFALGAGAVLVDPTTGDPSLGKRFVRPWRPHCACRSPACLDGRRIWTSCAGRDSRSLRSRRRPARCRWLSLRRRRTLGSRWPSDPKARVSAAR